MVLPGQSLRTRFGIAIAALLVVSQLALLGHFAFEDIDHADECEICLTTQHRLAEASAAVTLLPLIAVFVGVISASAPAVAGIRLPGFRCRAPPLR